MVRIFEIFLLQIFLYFRPKIAASEFGHSRTVEEALTHFNRCFLNGPISEIVLEGTIRFVKDFKS